MSQSQFMTHQRGRAKCTEYTRSPPTEYTPIYTGPPQGDPTYPSAQTVVYVLGALTMVAGLVMVFLLWPRGNTIYDGPLAVDAVSWPTPPATPHRAAEPARGARSTPSGPRGANDAARPTRPTATPALTIAQRARMLEFVMENGGVTFPVVAPTPIPPTPTPDAHADAPQRLPP